MPFHIQHGDITRCRTDAIVNAANTRLQRGGGVCGAIFAAADGRKLQEACDLIGGCPMGQAVLTGSFGLPARYVIHTVGPIWRGGDHHERELLESCYRSSLALAARNGCASIAFPLISAGIFGYPREEALAVAEETIRAFLEETGDRLDVTLVLFDG